MYVFCTYNIRKLNYSIYQVVHDVKRVGERYVERGGEKRRNLAWCLVQYAA